MNLWPRRIITGLGLILVIALIVWGVVALVRAIVGTLTPDPVPQSAPQSVQSGTVDASGYTLKGGQEVTADGLLTNGTSIEIPVCLEKDIAVTSQASAATAGSTMYVQVTLENRGAVACATSLSDYTLQVSTGGQQVYDSARCEVRVAQLGRPRVHGWLHDACGWCQRGSGRHLQDRCPARHS